MERQRGEQRWGGWRGGWRVEEGEDSVTHLANSDDERWKHKHGQGHPGDIGFEAPRLDEVAPAVKLPWRQLRPGENEHLGRRGQGQGGMP